MLDLRDECQTVMASLFSDFDTKGKHPQLIIDGFNKALEGLLRKEHSAASLEEGLKAYRWPEGYLFVLGDSVKKYSIEESTCSPMALLSALKKWIQSVSGVLTAWKDRSRPVETLERDAKSIDHSVISKWFSAKRCQDHIASLISRSRS